MAEAEIVVQLRTQSPTELAGPLGVARPADLHGWLARRFGVTAEPLHPGGGDPDSARWLRVGVPADTDAEAVAAALRARPDVEAAYVKPPADLP
ncbi:hypothetical protein ACFWAT_03765 [Streptomyces syringium]|uniref:hypothetical protein n=1 Tax=Streptomyces syringium TaxID=76729 RepID=UPI00366211FF